MYNKTNNVTGQIGADGTRDIFSSIRALDAGIANHEAWLGEVHQSLVCAHHHTNTADLREDAHCHCKFGQWLYSSGSESLKGRNKFHSVEQQHQQMHALARNILLTKGQQQEISEQDYGDFTAGAIAFKLEVRNLQYELMSDVCVVDHLTGAFNRYAMYSKLHQEKERLARTGHPCSICMMDLDHFKNINDRHGHQAGDLVLKAVIDFARESLRKYDSIYRYGGEEFLFFLPDSEPKEVNAVIERFRTALSQKPIPLPNGDTISITASFGIAGLAHETSVEDTIQEADHALLCAKAQGRDRVCNWADGLSAFHHADQTS